MCTAYVIECTNQKQVLKFGFVFLFQEGTVEYCRKIVDGEEELKLLPELKDDLKEYIGMMEEYTMGEKDFM